MAETETTGFTTGFRLAGSHVVHESIDGETIAIDLQSGRYFSFDDLGSRVWAALLAGAPADAIAAAICAASGAGPDEVDQALGAFFEQLVTIDLLARGAAEARDVDAAPFFAGLAGFQGPSVQAYTDMQELLALDPIHEVDAEGWPGSA